MKLLAAAALFAAGAPLCIAQNIAPPDPASKPAEPNYTQSQPAPIERAYPNRSYPDQYQRPYDRHMPGPVTLSPGGVISATRRPLTANPIPGVILRVAPGGSVKEVASSPQRLELRIESGVANLNVHDPQKDVVILVDLPGGQTQTLKNGLYTFNAATNTARVLKGEALAFPATAPNTKPLKVKEYNKIEFGKDTRPHEFVPQQALADLIPAPPRGPEQNSGGSGYGSGYGYGPGYGYAPYGDGYPYGYYPYYGFAEPYPWGPWGYPYGFYPYGIGFGFYGGWGYRGGFHGGGFHGRR
jgi:hypothetical protein